MSETTFSIVKTYITGGSTLVLVLTIPKEVRERLNIKRGNKFYVKVDDKGRIIYEPLGTSKK